MSLKGDGAKMFAMMLFVFCFFISGYEHSIANMCTFAIALVLNQSGTISFGGVLHNLIPVTIGNLIGGIIFMGFMYYYVNKPYLDAEDKEKLLMNKVQDGKKK
ncbi:Nitrite transporter NirC [compost metagenome]